MLLCCRRTAELHLNELWLFFLPVHVLVWFGSSQNLGSVRSAQLNSVRFGFLFSVYVCFDASLFSRPSLFEFGLYGSAVATTLLNICVPGV